MSDNERKQLDAAAELLSELDKQLQREQKLLWLAYGMGLADGAKTVEVQQAAGYTVRIRLVRTGPLLTRTKSASMQRKQFAGYVAGR